MRATPASKTDLIISMTLAEVFLLILFVVWYSQGAGAGPEWERIAKDRERQIDHLKAELQTEQEKILELERIRDWWRKSFGVNPPASMEDLVALRPQGVIVVPSGTEASAEGPKKRSDLTPKCSELGLKEVLFATVIRGRDSFGLNSESKKFDEILTAYAPELRESKKKDCRYIVDVSYQQGVRTDDYVFALRRLRSTFYVQLR